MIENITWWVTLSVAVLLMLWWLLRIIMKPPWWYSTDGEFDQVDREKREADLERIINIAESQIPGHAKIAEARMILLQLQTMTSNPWRWFVKMADAWKCLEEALPDKEPTSD